MFTEKGATSGKSGRQSRAPRPRLHRSYTHSFDGVSLSLPGDRVSELLDHAEVASVWPDSTVKALSDPEATGSGGPEAAGAEDGVARLHAEGITGKGVKVGIIDTGIDYRHPDLKGVYKGGYDFVDDDADPMETTYEDWKASGQAETNAGSTYYTEHGTHVAGIIAGQGADAKARAATASPPTPPCTPTAFSVPTAAAVPATSSPPWTRRPTTAWTSSTCRWAPPSTTRSARSP